MEEIVAGLSRLVMGIPPKKRGAFLWLIPLEVE